MDILGHDISVVFPKSPIFSELNENNKTSVSHFGITRRVNIDEYDKHHKQTIDKCIIYSKSVKSSINETIYSVNQLNQFKNTNDLLITSSMIFTFLSLTVEKYLMIPVLVLGAIQMINTASCPKIKIEIDKNEHDPQHTSVEIGELDIVDI